MEGLAPYTNQFNCVLFLSLLTPLNCWTSSPPFHNLNICPCVNFLSITNQTWPLNFTSNPTERYVSERDLKQHKNTPVKWTFKQTLLQNSTDSISLMVYYHQTLNGGKSWTWSCIRMLLLIRHTSCSFVKYCL